MPGTSFKSYVVNYDLVVNSTAAEGFAQVAQMAQRMQKPLKDISNHFKRLQQSASALKKGGAFEIKPTVDLTTFDKQAQTLVTKAEKVASQVNAILNGAFTVNPASAKTKGGKGTKGGVTPSKTEKRTLTTAQLQKEADNVKKQLRDLYGPRGVMRESAKGYKSLMESIQKDAAKLANFKSLRTQLSAINEDIKAAGKNGGKITKTITDGVATGIIKGTKKGGKKLVQQPQVTEAFNGVLQNLVAGKAVQIPVSVVANTKTAESVNAAMAKMRSQIKPLVIPITVATNIDAAKAVRETVSGLQNVITPSSSGKKPVGKGKGVSASATTPIVKTAEQKALEKEQRALKSELNKYNFWKGKHDAWKQKVADLKSGAAVGSMSNLTDAQLDKALEKVLYTDKGKKRIKPVPKPVLQSLTPAETAELNALTLATDPLIQEKARLESRLAALKKSAARKALTGKKFEEAKNIQNTLLPQINQKLAEAGEGRRATLLAKQADYGKQYAAQKKAYDEFQRNSEQYHKQLDREQKALTKKSVQDKILRAANTFAAIPTSKLPEEPRLAEGIRTPEQIAARQAEISQRLEAIRGTVAPPTSKGKGVARRGGTGARPAGISIPVTQAIQPLQNLANGRAIGLNTRVISNGQAGFDLNQHLVRLQELALSRPIKIDTRVIPTGTAAFDLNMHIQRLQELAMSRPVRLNTILAPNAVGAKGAAGTPLNAVPMEGVVENVVVSKGVKVSGGPVKVEGMMDKVGLAKGAKVSLPDISRQVANLKELSNVWKTLPKTGSRTFTVNLKTPGIENLAKLKELIGIVNSMPQSTRRIFTAGIGGGGRGNNGTSTTGIYGGGRRADTRFAGRPRGTMNTFAYQLMGNTSLGARTPVFLDMMKGMGMMTGVGAAMGTLTTAFTNASEYQNTMVTTKSILEANYQGSNFNKDFGNMERIVRDVAKKTKFTAPQAADAARFMAMAGLNIPMINASIRPIADVATIGDNDLGEVADKITNIQTAFGIQPNKMRALADALTKTFTSSNTDMMMLAESMEYAAPMAHLAGAQVEDALAMIGIMGNAGIQGSMAGTTLRMMYQNVINPNKKQKKMWESLGISLKDAQGNPRQLIEILGDLRKKVRISREDKDEEGRFKDEGTPIAAAVSQLFRVTASAGAGTLLENLDKVIALAEANRNAEGLSQRISEVKQNDVKGMWAKMTSAFTDAVVTEFEKQDSPIKGYLENITKYFNSGEFKDLLHDVFDLVTSMMDMLGKFVKIWREIYKIFGPIIKYTLMAQFILTQIGYMLAPLRSIYMTVARGVGAVKGMMTGTAVASVAGGGAGTAAVGGGFATSAAAMSANKSVQALRNTPITATVNGRTFTSMAAMESAIARKQMQWYATSRINDATINRYVNNGRFWSTAYTHPEQAFAMSPIGRKQALMARQAAEVSAMQNGLNNMQSEQANRQQQIRTIYAGLGAERRASRVLSNATLKRAVKMGKMSRMAAAGTMLRQTGSAVAGGLGLTGLFSGLASAGKALAAFATGPVGIATIAIGALGFGIYKIIEARREEEERIRRVNNQFIAIAETGRQRFNEALKPVFGESVFGQLDTINVASATINVESEKENNRILSKAEEYQQLLELFNMPMVGDRLKDIQDSSLLPYYNTYITRMRDMMPNLPSTPEAFTSNHRSALAYTTAAIIGAEGLKNPDYLQAQSEIEKLANDLNNGKIVKEKYDEAISEIAERFNPAKKLGLMTIGSDYENARFARNVDESTVYEWWQSQYNSLLSGIGDKNLARTSAEAYYNISSRNLQAKTPEWYEEFARIIGTKNINWGQSTETGELVKFPFPIKDGMVDLSATAQRLLDEKVTLANPAEYYVSALLGIIDDLKTDPKIQELLRNITPEELITHLLTDNAALQRQYQMDELAWQRHLDWQKQFRDTIPLTPDPALMMSLESLRGNPLAPAAIYRNDILSALRRSGYAAPDSLYNRDDLNKESTRFNLDLMNPNQSGYKMKLAIPVTPPPAHTTIQKLEVNITNNGELDEKKVAEMVGQEVGKQQSRFYMNLIDAH